jgi:hypothetical protein
MQERAFYAEGGLLNEEGYSVVDSIGVDRCFWSM